MHQLLHSCRALGHAQPVPMLMNPLDLVLYLLSLTIHHNSAMEFSLLSEQARLYKYIIEIQVDGGTGNWKVDEDGSRALMLMLSSSRWRKRNHKQSCTSCVLLAFFFNYISYHESNSLLEGVATVIFNVRRHRGQTTIRMAGGTDRYRYPTLQKTMLIHIVPIHRRSPFYHHPRLFRVALPVRPKFWRLYDTLMATICQPLLRTLGIFTHTPGHPMPLKPGFCTTWRRKSWNWSASS